MKNFHSRSLGFFFADGCRQVAVPAFGIENEAGIRHAGKCFRGVRRAFQAIGQLPQGPRQNAALNGYPASAGPGMPAVATPFPAAGPSAARAIWIAKRAEDSAILKISAMCSLSPK